MQASELEARRAYECRLTPDRALTSLEEAAWWLEERGMVTRTPDCSLPSFHLAMHEEPYRVGSRGFGAYPRTKYVWVFELARRPGVHQLRIHRGKDVFLTERVARLVDPLARDALAAAEAGAYGEDARRVVAHLAAAGPTLVEEVKEELGLATSAFRTIRARLEAKAAIVATSIVIDAPDVPHRHTSELRRWDEVFRVPSAGGLDDLVVAGVGAAVLAPERELRAWFSWRVAAADVERLVEDGRLIRPAAGAVAVPDDGRTR
jgi:hypothetical protein